MIWRTARRQIDLRERGVIMGILNVTPDSFSDGGRHAGAGDAVARALEMVAEGAEILDVGGESTRPGATPVDEDEELARVIPVIRQLARKTGAAISVDTSKARVAAEALEAGAEIINDVTALRGDPAMARVAADSGAGVILMHMRGTPRDMQDQPHYEDVVRETGEFLRERLAAAGEAGIPPGNIALDPGLGFGKLAEHNWQLVAGLASLMGPGRPLVLGASRKAFLGALSGEKDPSKRDGATAALTALGRMMGARVFRVHSPAPNLQALRAAEAVMAAA